MRDCLLRRVNIFLPFYKHAYLFYLEAHTGYNKKIK